MIQTLVASRAAKLIAACVCPVAGAGTLTVAVPEVRQAVHRATAPRAAPRRSRVVRPRPVVQPAVAAVECPPTTPVILTSDTFAPPVATDASLASLPPLGDSLAPPGIPGTYVPVTPIGFVPIVPPTGPGTNPPPVTPPPAVPEPATWVQMILGFGLIGVATSRAYRRRGDEELA